MPASDKWARITANLEPHVAALAKARARARHQSVAGYVTTLIEQDIAAVGEGPQAGYGDGASSPNLSRNSPLGEAMRAAQAEAAKIPPQGLPDPQESQPAAKGKRARKSRKRGGTK